MTADSFYTVKNTSEREREITTPTIHKVSSVKLHWYLGLFNLILRLRQIEYIVIVILVYKFCTKVNRIVKPYVVLRRSEFRNVTFHNSIHYGVKLLNVSNCFYRHTEKAFHFLIYVIDFVL